MPQEDLKKAVENTRGLLEESRIPSETLDTNSTFTRLFKAIRKFPRPPRPGDTPGTPSSGK